MKTEFFFLMCFHGCVQNIAWHTEGAQKYLLNRGVNEDRPMAQAFFTGCDLRQPEFYQVAEALGIGPGLWLALEPSRCHCLFLSLSSAHTHTLGLPVTPLGSPAGSPQREAVAEAS